MNHKLAIECLDVYNHVCPNDGPAYVEKGQILNYF